jgi:hypothetical protein
VLSYLLLLKRNLARGGPFHQLAHSRGVCRQVFVVVQVVHLDLPDVSTRDSIVRVAGVLDVLLARVRNNFRHSKHLNLVSRGARLPQQVLSHLSVELHARVCCACCRTRKPRALNRRVLPSIGYLLL